MIRRTTRGELLLRHISDTLERFPRLYCEVMRLRLRPTKRVVSGKTVICIEGFPRCANSFAVQAFHQANDPERKLHVATHLHSPAHVLECLRRHIPTIVLIRKPEECIVSWIALAIQLGKIKGRQTHKQEQLVRMRYWLRRYSHFYETLMPFKGKYVTADFPETTTDFGQVVTRLNALTNAGFSTFTHTSQTVSDIFQNSKVHLSPSALRDEIKAAVKPLYRAGSNKEIRCRAEAAYASFLDSNNVTATQSHCASTR